MSKHEQNRDGLNYREHAQVRAASIDEEGRSVEAVFTTENPTPMWDWERWEMVPEVLRMDGAEWPQQVPFLNAHSRASVSDVLGSGRSIRTEGGNLVGRLHFAKRAQDVFDMVKEGHLTDVSVGYQVLEKTYVPKGEKAIVKGREYTGPVNVATRWKGKEISQVPIGADEQAKLRGFDQFPHSKKENFTVNKELRELCVKLGMKADATDEEAQAFLAKTLSEKHEPEQITPAKPAAGLDEKAILSIFEKVVEQREAKSKAFRAEVKGMCELAGLGDDVVREAYDAGDLTAARALILERKAKAATSLGHITYSADQPRDAHVADLRTAIVEKCLNATGYEPKPHPVIPGKMQPDRREEIQPAASKAKGAANFKGFTWLRLAEECLQADGYRLSDIRGLTRENLAIAALGWPGKAGLRATSDGAYNTTGTFNLLTQDAQNKSMMLGYVEVEQTWRGPMRQGASVDDFKDINRYRLGAIPNIPIWPDNKDPEKASMGQAREKYALEARSLEIGFSYRLLINDDMDALSRTPFQMGNAGSRTVNAFAWSLITSNPSMSDGQLLFLETATGNRKRSNLTTGTATPTVSIINGMCAKMALMRGENTPENNEGADILGLTPVYLAGPRALYSTIWQFIYPGADPASSNAAVKNPFSNMLTPVFEPLLDAASTTAFYLFASPSQIDTVEVSFLNGQESPVTRTWMDERNLSQNTTILQTFGGAPMNHRGIQKHNGV